MFYLLTTSMLFLRHVGSLPLDKFGGTNPPDEQLFIGEEERIVAQVDSDIKDLQGLNLKIRGLR